MKKIVAAMVIGLIFIAGTACGGSDKKSSTPIVINSASAEKKALCVEAMDSVNEGLAAMSDGIDAIAYSSNTEIRSFLATAKRFVSTSIAAAQECSEFAPAEAAKLIRSLNGLEDAIDAVASKY